MRYKILELGRLVVGHCFDHAVHRSGIHEKQGQSEKKRYKKKNRNGFKEQGKINQNSKQRDKSEIEDDNPNKIVPHIEKCFFYQKTKHDLK